MTEDSATVKADLIADACGSAGGGAFVNMDPDAIRGFIDGYLARRYNTGFGVSHSFVVCIPTDEYRRGFLAGQASRLCRN